MLFFVLILLLDASGGNYEQISLRKKVHLAVLVCNFLFS